MNILILARMTRAFTGKTAREKPLGGSESALLYLSKELAALGNKITIFNHCAKSENGIYDGVEYLSFSTLADLIKYSKTRNFDVFISFRDLPAFLFPLKARLKIWWGHDDFSNLWNQPYPLKIPGNLFLKFAGFLINRLADYLFVVSYWLKDICIRYLGIKAEKIWVARNGINLEYFQQKVPRERFRLIYTSVPDRGLDTALEMFPKIKAQVPQAELFLFCGFDLGVLNEKDRTRAQALYEKTKIPGVHLMGNRKHSELAVELQKSRLFIYPSHEVLAAGFYAETSCIAVLESLAAATPVITSRRGALPETVQTGYNGVLIEGNAYAQAYQERFVAETVKLLLDEQKWQAMSQNALASALKYSWKEIAGEWDRKLKQLISQS